MLRSNTLQRNWTRSATRILYLGFSLSVRRLLVAARPAVPLPAGKNFEAVNAVGAELASGVKPSLGFRPRAEVVLLDYVCGGNKRVPMMLDVLQQVLEAFLPFVREGPSSILVVSPAALGAQGIPLARLLRVLFTQAPSR